MVNTRPPVLFNYVLKKVVRDVNIYRMVLVYHKRHQCMAFADDVVVARRGKTELVDVVKKLEETAANLGLEINQS